MKKRHKASIAITGLILAGFFLPEPKTLPVKGATESDWHQDSFWFEPWGTSGVHKGLDIFALKGTQVIASTNILVIYEGHIQKGGRIIVGLGPKWRIHYYAHLESSSISRGQLLFSGSEIGTVGDSGNARGKQPHLHYSIFSLIPLPWLIDNASQGYKKAFYLDPIKYLSG